MDGDGDGVVGNPRQVPVIIPICLPPRVRSPLAIVVSRKMFDSFYFAFSALLLIAGSARAQVFAPNCSWPSLAWVSSLLADFPIRENDHPFLPN